MAVKSFYVLTTTAVAPNWFGSLQDGGSAPAAANTAYGWQPGASAISTPYYATHLGATGASGTKQATSYIDATSGPTAGTGSAATTAGDSFVTPTPYGGNFAATNWTFDWNLRAGTAGAVGRLRMRVWASVNASGASARELTSGTQLSGIVTLSTTADVDAQIVWNPGAVALVNEYLFFQLEWQETTLGASNCNILFRQSTAIITTPDFAPGTFKTFYLLTSAAVTPNFWGNLQDGGSAPAGATSAYGYSVQATPLTTPYFWSKLGATAAAIHSQAGSNIDSLTGPSKGTGTSNTTAGDSFATPSAYSGTFDPTAWQFDWKVRANTSGGSNTGNIRMRVWASVNADGSAARELTSGALAGAVVTTSNTADSDSSISWSPGAITLNAEYLFFQLEWQETALGTSGITTLFRQGLPTITTPNFTASAPVVYYVPFDVHAPVLPRPSAVNPGFMTAFILPAFIPVVIPPTQTPSFYFPLTVETPAPGFPGRTNFDSLKFTSLMYSQTTLGMIPFLPPPPPPFVLSILPTFIFIPFIELIQDLNIVVNGVNANFMLQSLPVGMLLSYFENIDPGEIADALNSVVDEFNEGLSYLGYDASYNLKKFMGVSPPHLTRAVNDLIEDINRVVVRISP